MILWLHIGGGVLTLLSVGAAILMILQERKLTWIKRSLPVLAGWQVITGGLLVVSGGNLLRVCGMGVAYLSVVAVVYMWAGRSQRKLATESI